MFQFGCFLGMAVLCTVSALDWLIRSQYLSAVCFTAFAVGYVALAFIEKGVP